MFDNERQGKEMEKEYRATQFLNEYPDFLTVAQMSEITGECPATIRAAAARGQLKGIKIGRRWFFIKQVLIDSMLGAE